MRDSVTADDLAIESAKQKLVELVERDDYKAKMARVYKPEKGPKIVLAIMCTTSTASAVGLGWFASGPAWIGVTLLGLFAAFTGLGWLALAHEKPSQPFGVAVVGKARNEKKLLELELLRTDGEQVKAVVTDTIYDLVKPGDVGVAWLRNDASFHTMTDLERL